MSRQFTVKDFEEAKRFFDMFNEERDKIVNAPFPTGEWQQIIVFNNEGHSGSFNQGDEPKIAKVFQECLDRLKIEGDMQLRRHCFAFHTGMCMAFIHGSFPQLNSGLMLFYDLPSHLYPK
jgi:hypothetical protein